MFVVMLLAGSLVLQTSGEAKQKARTQNRAPVIKSFTASNQTVSLCPFVGSAMVNHTALQVQASDPDGDPLTYTYLVPAGTIEGNGSLVVWNLRKESPGTYRASVRVEDPNGNKVYATLNITALNSTACDAPPPPCPTVTVECPSEIESGKLISFVVTVTGGESLVDPYYRWKTDAGRIIDGKLEKKMTLDLMHFPFEKVTATVSIGGFDPSCTGTELSCTTRIKE